MTVYAADGSIVLSGDCPSEDADVLLQQLLALPFAAVDWRQCKSAHTAVVQLLIAARRPLLGPPQGVFLSDLIEPALKRTP